MNNNIKCLDQHLVHYHDDQCGKINDTVTLKVIAVETNGVTVPNTTGFSFSCSEQKNCGIIRKSGFSDDWSECQHPRISDYI